jgi:tetratricopeptide (TPR) repeat protein
MNKANDHRDSLTSPPPIRKTEAGAAACDGTTPVAADDFPDDFQVARPVRDLIRRVRKLGVPGESHSETLDAMPQGDTPQSDSTSWTGEFAAPSSIGRFRIEKMIGRGGFGLVYKAYDPELDRRVAIKVPRLDALASPDGRARFMRETRAVALLGHPGIVPVFEIGQLGPAPFIVMSLIEGGNLGQWIQANGKRLSNTSAAGLLAALAVATQHAHSRGIIHRDLKPANILLHNENGSPVREDDLAHCARISDFGMALVTHDDGLATHSGALVGTPAYMAPEQTRSRADSINAATDVYGLGAILYELLTGKPPFEGDTFASILAKVESEPPIAPRKINPELSADLEAICLKCLEKQASRRYQSASELEADLQRFLDDIPVLARRPGPAENLLRWVNRNRAVTAATLITIAALAIGLGSAMRQARIAGTNLRESERQRLRAEYHLDRTEQAIDQMLNEVADVLISVPGLTQFRASLLEKALVLERELAAVESDDPAVRLRAAKAQGKVGEIQLKLGQTEEAVASFEAAMTMLDAVVPQTGELSDQKEALVVMTQLMTGKAHAAKSRYRELETTVLPVAELYSGRDAASLSLENLRGFSLALSLLGRAQTRLNQPAAAEQSFLKVAEVLSRIPDADRIAADRIDLAMNWTSLANLYRSTGRTTPAIEAYETSIREVRRLLETAPERPHLRSSLVLALANLAGTRIESGENELALACYRDALPEIDILIGQFPDYVQHHQLKMSVLCGRAVSQANSGGDPDGTREMYREAIAFGESMLARFGSSPSLQEELSRAYGNLAVLLHKKLARPDEARPCFEKQISLARELVQASPRSASRSWSLSLALGNFADLHLDQDRLETAEPLFREAEEVARMALEIAPDSAVHINNLQWQQARLSTLLCRQGRYRESLDKALEIAAIAPSSPESRTRCAAAITSLLAWLREHTDEAAARILSDAERELERVSGSGPGLQQ